MSSGALTGNPAPATITSTRVAGISTLKGLILYGAVLTFAGLYVYFIVKITQASPGSQPLFDATLVSAAAALAGVLGSAFALEIGTTTDAASANHALGEALANAAGAEKVMARIRQILSLEPSSTGSASWPKTFGIWVYALVAAGVAVTYVLNQNETPSAIKALAVAFGGYVIALVTAAYKTAAE